MSELDNINEMVDRIARKRAARELLAATATALDELDGDLAINLRDMIDAAEESETPTQSIIRGRRKARAAAAPDEEADDAEKPSCSDCGARIRKDSKDGRCKPCRAKAKKA